MSALSLLDAGISCFHVVTSLIVWSLTSVKYSREYENIEREGCHSNNSVQKYENGMPGLMSAMIHKIQLHQVTIKFHF